MSTIPSLEQVTEWLTEAGLQCAWRLQSSGLWAATALQSSYVPVAYTEAMLDYQRKYMQGAGCEFIDLSMILFHDHQPCGVWPLCLRKRDSIVLGSNEGAVLPPLFCRNIAVKSAKSQCTACLDFLDRLARETGGDGYDSLVPYREEHGTSEWQTQLLRRGASTCVRQTLWVDISQPLTQIKASFRKSYKALISSGARQWRTHLLTDADQTLWEEFRALHFVVAGRVTRSADSWQQQLAAIQNQDAFLVYLRDGVGRMVGGGFFHVSRDEGLYAVAAYDRQLFDHPLGHVVQYAAIQELQRRNVKWYNIGTRYYPQDEPPPTPKEVSVAVFKEGFATHNFPLFTLTRLLSDERQRKLQPGMVMGDRLCLRLLAPEDATDAYVSWLNDPVVNQYLEVRFSKNNRETTAQYIRTMLASPRDYFFGIFLRDTQEHIGTIKIGEIDSHHQSAELGLLLGATASWGKGYGTEAVKIATQFSFECLKLHKIVASIYTPNLGSTKIFERLGFRQIGCLKAHRFYGGRYVDCVLMEKLNPADGHQT